jgi:putative phosphoesterase
MRYAIISDIHSNLESFKVCLKIFPKLKIEKIICLGDIVGYNPNPNECVYIISTFNNLEIVRGNHDKAVTMGDYSYFSEHAKDAIKWTIKNINHVSFDYLNNIEKGPKIVDDLFAICHGSALDEENYMFMPFHTKGDFLWLKKNNIKILFFGHTHYQVVFSMNKSNDIETINNNTLTLDPGSYYLINPGSIGQPRDNDPRASFIVFDSDKMQINVIRYNYPFHITQEKIIDHSLPEFLAERLAYGY